MYEYLCQYPWHKFFQEQVDRATEKARELMFHAAAAGHDPGRCCYLAVRGTPGRLVVVDESDPGPVDSEALPCHLEREALRSWIVKRAKFLPIVGE